MIPGVKDVTRELFQIARDYVELAWLTKTGWLRAFENEYRRLPVDDIELEAFRGRVISDGRIKAAKICELAKQFADITGVPASHVGYYSRVMDLDEEDSYKARKEAAMIRAEQERDFDSVYPDWGNNKVWD